ncbi:MAG: sugar phosphate isomerase/epimerase [Anaerolineae bacterium]|nr:sugar phosphate isomerase/epimerase [Anaerolineae bacterium]
MAGRFLEIYTNCYGKFGLAAAIAHAPTIGISHLEVALRKHEGTLVVPAEVILTDRSSRAQVDAARTALEQAGITPSSCGGGADVRTTEGLEALKRRIDIAAQMGARWFTGSTGQADDKRELYEGTLEIADYAQSKGILICLETHPPLITNADVALATLKDLQHPNIKVNWDTGNVYYYNEGLDGEEQLQKIAPHIGHVHFKDSRKGFKEWYFPALGKGTIDLGRCLAIMREAGFNGPFSIEIEGIAGEGEQTLEQRQENVRLSVEHLRHLGIEDLD